MTTRRTIDFAGRRWWVKRSDVPTGPGGNVFDDSPVSVEVDGGGRLVLRVHRRGDRWTCAEVVGEAPTGCGRYEWTVHSNMATFDRHIVCGMFTWSDDAAHDNHELDVEVSAWGRSVPTHVRFVVQPWDRPCHVRDVPLTATRPWRCSLDWSPRRVVFTAGDTARWTFDGDGVPDQGPAHPRINLWLDGARAPASPSSVTIGDFRFTPARG